MHMWSCCDFFSELVNVNFLKFSQYDFFILDPGWHLIGERSHFQVLAMGFVRFRSLMTLDQWETQYSPSPPTSASKGTDLSKPTPDRPVIGNAITLSRCCIYSRVWIILKMAWQPLPPNSLLCVQLPHHFLPHDIQNPEASCPRK
jgi:hypothetical protein